MKFKTLLIAAFLIVLISGCAEFEDMLKIREELIRQYNHKNIQVNVVNSKNMTVIFINSPFNQLERNERGEKAEGIAVYCAGLFNEDSKIENLKIVFLKHERKFFIIDYTKEIESYVFKVSDLRQILFEKEIQEKAIRSVL